MKRPVCFAAFVLTFAALSPAQVSDIGREVAIPRHLQDGEEYDLPVPQLIDYGKKLFNANWTIQDGAGRPQSKGTGAALSDQAAPLVFPRSFNRVSVRWKCSGWAWGLC